MPFGGNCIAAEKKILKNWVTSMQHVTAFYISIKPILYQTKMKSISILVTLEKKLKLKLLFTNKQPLQRITYPTMRETATSKNIPLARHCKLCAANTNSVVENDT